MYQCIDLVSVTSTILIYHCSDLLLCLLYLKEEKLNYMLVWIFTKGSTYIIIWSTPRKDQVVSKWTACLHKQWTLTESFAWKVPSLCSQGFSYISYMWWTPKNPAFPCGIGMFWVTCPGCQGRGGSWVCVCKISGWLSFIADLWWRLYLAGLIQKSHRLDVLADCLSFQLFPFVKGGVCGVGGVYCVSSPWRLNLWDRVCVNSCSVVQGICS